MRDKAYFAGPKRCPSGRLRAKHARGCGIPGHLGDVQTIISQGSLPTVTLFFVAMNEVFTNTFSYMPTVSISRRRIHKRTHMQSAVLHWAISVGYCITASKCVRGHDCTSYLKLEDSEGFERINRARSAPLLSIR